MEIYHHTHLYQTQWLGKRLNGRTERISKVNYGTERKKERKKGRRPKVKPQGDEWIK